MTDSDAELIAARVMRRIGEMLMGIGTLVVEGPLSKDPSPPPPPPPPDRNSMGTVEISSTGIKI